MIALRRRPSFPRGIHPAEAKHLSRDVPVEVLPTPASVRVPLHQHLGQPATITVKPRTEVAPGDVVGEAAGFISSPVHASVAGQTGRPGPKTLPNGRRVDTVPIKVSEEQPVEGRALYDQQLGGEWPLEPPAGLAPEAVADAAREAGIVGHGGAAFPSHVKLIRQEAKPVDTILINGCECEPYLTSDYRLMLESPGSVVSGALLAKYASDARRVVICLESNAPEAAAALRKVAAGTGVEVLELQQKYPQGGEKSLTLAVLGRSYPTGGLPLDIGAVVLNVATASALARKVHRGHNLTHRVVCVTGEGVVHPKNLLVPLGARFGDLLDACGGLRPDASRLLAGGPMMGFSFQDLDSPVTKGSGGLTALTAEQLSRAKETACLRCGRCVDVCPLHLVPTHFAAAVRAGNLEMAERRHLNVCMECGCCAYGCPAHLPLVQLIRTGKAALRARDA